MSYPQVVCGSALFRVIAVSLDKEDTPYSIIVWISEYDEDGELCHAFRWFSRRRDGSWHRSSDGTVDHSLLIRNMVLCFSHDESSMMSLPDNIDLKTFLRRVVLPDAW